MQKLCVFCGQKPDNKNKEHIIPRWLIEYTGDPKRNINLGLKMDRDNQSQYRNYAFDKFVMPACERCNSDYGRLENKVKSIIINIIEKNELNYSNISILLDWFDKVRVGLWSAFMVLNDNVLNLEPHMSIKNRIGTSDRFLYVYKTTEPQTGINFIGTDSLVFQMLPSCFTLRINNFYFFNASKEFLFSRRYGFPYITSRQYKSADSDQQFATIKNGTEKMVLPLIKGNDFILGTEIFQPMIVFSKRNLKDSESYSKFYDNNYVRENCINYEDGIGKPIVLCGKKRIIDKNTTGINTLKFPTSRENPILFHMYITKQTYEYQLKLIEQSECSYNNIPEKTAEIWKDKTMAAINYNNFIIKLLYKEIREHFGQQ